MSMTDSSTGAGPRKLRVYHQNIERGDIQGVTAMLRCQLEVMKGKTVIMAGHYITVFRHAGRELVPLVGNDPTRVTAEKAFYAEMGDFPEATFEIGLRLITGCDHLPLSIALLVNDRWFAQFQGDQLMADEACRLRGAYYRAPNALPGLFRDLMTLHGLDETCLESNDSDRSSSNPLPSQTRFFSENVLKNRFERTGRKDELLQLPGFEQIEGAISGRKLVFRSPMNPSGFCFYEETAQDPCSSCSGVMLEFLVDLNRRGAKNLMLLIPYECREQVHESIVGAMSVLVDFNRVVAVWADQAQYGRTTYLSKATVYSISR